MSILKFVDYQTYFLVFSGILTLRAKEKLLLQWARESTVLGYKAGTSTHMHVTP